MQRRKYSRKFKIGPVRLIRERGVSVARASRDLDVHESVLRKWVKEFSERFLRRMIKILREEAPGNKL